MLTPQFKYGNRTMVVGGIFSGTMVPIHKFAETLGRTIDLKDSYTQHHSEAVADIAYLIAKEMRLDSDTCDKIHVGGHLHDVGKIGVSDLALKSDKKLSKKQWLQVQMHPMLGYEILKDVIGLNEMDGVADMVLYHHERYDGSGYPEGIKSDRIPLGARILGVADSFSAMIDDRRYRDGMLFNKAVDEIVDNIGVLFDPAVVAAFSNVESTLLSGLKRAEKIRCVKLSSDPQLTKFAKKL